MSKEELIIGYASCKTGCFRTYFSPSAHVVFAGSALTI